LSYRGHSSDCGLRHEPVAYPPHPNEAHDKSHEGEYAEYFIKPLQIPLEQLQHHQRHHAKPGIEDLLLLHLMPTTDSFNAEASHTVQ
jgi:hypothetical protein